MTPEQMQFKPSAARRTREMIGQEEASHRLQEALRPGDRSVQVVLVKAEGGMGKTRLLEEILRVHGPQYNPEAADVGADHMPELPDLLITQLIDVIDTRLHDRYRFVSELRRSLLPYRGGLDFSRFEAADNRVRVLTARGALLNPISDAQNRAVDAFIADLVRIAERRRVVILIDTVERLNYHHNEWLLEEGLLRDSDLEIRTHHWLRRFIADPRLENVTLVLAGRGREGSEFFERMTTAVAEAAEAGCPCRPVDILLKRFNLNQTRQYFAQLAEDWRADDDETLAGHFDLAANPSRDLYKVIGLYTHGVPVRLALYAQLIVEKRDISADFKRSFAQACQWAGLDPQEIDFDAELPNADDAPSELQSIQWKVEEGFLDLLFVDSQDDRAAVLRALVRAPRGLTAEQLHFALHAPTDVDADIWQAAVRRGEGDHPTELAWLLDLLQDIAKHEYLAKARPALEFGPFTDRTEPKSDTFRVGLQDEIYRIYAEHMGLLADPVSPDTEVIRRNLTEGDRQRYIQNQLDEAEKRKTLYTKLAEFADYQYRHHLAAKRENLRQDESDFEKNFRLEAAITYSFPDLPAAQVNLRHRQHTAQAFYEIERMVYRLLQDPEHNLNTDYIALEDDNDRAARQEEDFWAQAEMWRVVHDDWLMKFVRLDDRSAAKQRGETAVDVLRRFADQENVTRWIKRFVLRSSSDRTQAGERRDIAFGEALQAHIRDWPRGNPQDKKDPDSNRWNSWNHTLASAERVIWTKVAYIRRGIDVTQAAGAIEDEIVNLQKLFDKDVRTGTIRADDGRVENGFAAAPATEDKPALPAHPAFARLRRLLSHAYNHLGYSQRTLGHMHKAVVHYGQALDLVRGESEMMKAHRALVLNGLSRALSELGWNSTGVCLNGRDLRWDLAEEVPLANSYNTLALIYDDMGRYEDAPLLSAKAIAYCRRALESRQLALSLRQMAESLRHLADRANTGQRTAVTPEAYYDVAETLLREAQTIFEELNQTERRVEVYLELGSLERDRLGRPRKAAAAQADSYDWALSYLGTAERLATENHLAQHVLDAQINLARVYYYAGKGEAAARTLQAIMDNADYQSHRITPDHLPDVGGATPQSEELRDRNWIFRHLSTAWWIRGWMMLDRFSERVSFIRNTFSPEEQLQVYKNDRPPVTDNPRPPFEEAHQEPIWEEQAQFAQVSLEQAARAYTLAIAYAERYSPRSRSIGTIQNDLYNRLRTYDHDQLADFGGYLKQVGEKYRGLPSVPLLHLFLGEFYGLTEQPTATDPAALAPAIISATERPR